MQRVSLRQKMSRWIRNPIRNSMIVVSTIYNSWNWLPSQRLLKSKAPKKTLMSPPLNTIARWIIYERWRTSACPTLSLWDTALAQHKYQHPWTIPPPPYTISRRWMITSQMPFTTTITIWMFWTLQINPYRMHQSSNTAAITSILSLWGRSPPWLRTHPLISITTITHF